MKFIAHRGFWSNIAEQNTEKAFIKALENGYGIETDVRDYNGEVVIAHDLPVGSTMPFTDFLALHQNYALSSDTPLYLAINIKADGLTSKLWDALSEAQTKDYFVFDMSVPDALHYLKQNMPTFTRQSEYEADPSFYDEATGVWIDCFNSCWFSLEVVETHLRNGKQVCIVSPELHKRENYIEEQWHKLSHLADNNRLLLCSDFPHLAEKYFLENV